MKLNSVLSLGVLTAAAAMAQGPMYDKIIVNLPYAVTINETVLPAGEYEIRQDSSPTNNRVLRFFTDKGMKFETTAMAIAALDNKTPEETSVVLEKYGSDYYLNKVWVQGKNYGYEFPVPANIRNRERERNPTTVAARYESAPAQTTTAPPAPRVDTTEPPPARVEASETVAPPPPARVDAQPAREPEQTRSFELAQNTPPPAVTPSQGAADTTPAMPATSANWLNLVLAGGSLAGLGMMMRRVKA